MIYKFLWEISRVREEIVRLICDLSSKLNVNELCKIVSFLIDLMLVIINI